jgi:hypothetical protein
MYLLYADESGDTGLKASPSRFFCIVGLTVHESHWRESLRSLIEFKRSIRVDFAVPLRREIHASEFVRSPVCNLPLHSRLEILKRFLEHLARMPHLSATCVAIDKSQRQPPFDVFEFAWKLLFQRFEDTLAAGNFPGGHANDRGTIFVDDTNGRKLTRLVRSMAVFNYIRHDESYGEGTRNKPIDRIIEDPSLRSSATSLYIQAADVLAYFLTQYITPNRLIKRNVAEGWFLKAEPILNKRASRKDPLGVVRY